MNKRTGYLFFLVCMLFPVFSGASEKNTGNNFLVLSDIHLDQASLHAMEIDPTKSSRENDLDGPTFEKLISTAGKNIKNGVVAQPDFIIVLGDILGHFRISSDYSIKSESSVFSVLKNSFPHTPIFYVYGNNDSLAADYGPFKDSGSLDKYKSPYDVATINGGWIDGFLSTGIVCKKNENNFPCLLSEDNKNNENGYYSAYLKLGLRLISINSVLFSPKRTGVTEQEAIKQLQWLENQLERARTNQESVLIAMHVPPGNNVYDHSPFWMPKEQTAFLKIIESYHDIIMGLLASHTHGEEVKVIRNASGKNIMGVYLTAALSTSHGNAPSVKTFYFYKNNKQWLLSNYESFNFSKNHSGLVFNKIYDYRDYYCKPDQEGGLFQCLDNVTEDKMRKYLSAGNKNHEGVMHSPADIFLNM